MRMFLYTVWLRNRSYEWSDEPLVFAFAEVDAVFLICGRAFLDSTWKLVEEFNSESRALAYFRFEPTIGCRLDDLIRKSRGFDSWFGRRSAIRCICSFPFRLRFCFQQLTIGFRLNDGLGGSGMQNLLLGLHNAGVMFLKQPTSSSIVILWPLWLSLICSWKPYRPMKRYRGSPI